MVVVVEVELEGGNEVVVELDGGAVVVEPASGAPDPQAARPTAASSKAVETTAPRRYGALPVRSPRLLVAMANLHAAPIV